MRDSREHTLALTELRQHLSCSVTHSKDRLPDDFSTELLAAIDRLEEKKSSDLHEKRLVEMLKFGDISLRHEAIPEAYEQTFQWVLRKQNERSQQQHGRTSTAAREIPRQGPSWDNFVEWLEGDKSLYWITGKPGAGKSTLMKFLYHHPKTVRYAQEWLNRATSVAAAHRPSCQSSSKTQLSLAAFFSWNSGTSIQRSGVGLLRTLLVQLLQDQRNLITELFPERLQRCRLFGSDPRPLGWIELSNALHVLISTTRRHRLFFIDGLDEFEDNEHANIVAFVTNLASMDNVKVCVSSRPWMVFEDKFEDMPMLRVQELTRSDILLYIQGRFNAKARFRQLEKFRPQQAAKLVDNIADKASGVFLWVFVVVDSLIEGLRDGDDMDALLQRLGDLPDELEGLFDNIVNRLSPNYAKDASELFQFVRAFPDESTIIGLFFASKPWQRALETHCKPSTADEIQDDAETMRRRLYSRCKCLLDTDSHPRPFAPVRWLHRTVREYLEQPHVWNKIHSKSPEFDPHLTAAASLMLQVKTLGPQQVEALKSEWPAFAILKMIFYLASSQSITQEGKVAIFDHIDETANRLYGLDNPLGWPRDLTGQDFSNTWSTIASTAAAASSSCPSIAIPTLRTLGRPTSIFQLAVAADMDWYAVACVRRNKDLLNMPIGGQPVLDFSVKHKLWSMASLLLDSGIDPNVPHSGRTTWLQFMIIMENDMQGVCPIEVKRNYLHLLCEFLDRDADYTASTAVWKGEELVRRVIQVHAIEPELEDEVNGIKTSLRQAMEKRKDKKSFKYFPFPRQNIDVQMGVDWLSHQKPGFRTWLRMKFSRRS
jgi:hypothetical protein